MQAVVKKVVYSFRYRLGPGQVGREVFHIVLTLSRRLGDNKIGKDCLLERRGRRFLGGGRRYNSCV